MNLTTTISWFSAGVSSAVATKMAIDQIDRIIYQHIDDQESDTLRFVFDCERWFGKPVEIIQSPYKSVEAVCRAYRFIRSPWGAVCTKVLKRRLRMEWEVGNAFFRRFRYVWGFDATEQDRANDAEERMPDHLHVFPLIDCGMSKEEAHGYLDAAGINRPRMYELGYPNNNCIGCVKGGKGYWNKIRVDFPEEFAARCKLEREIGAHALKDCYLDELDPAAGRDMRIIVPECGAFCGSEADQ